MTANDGDADETATRNPVDKHVGHRVRERRMELGLSQDALAKRLGVTFQQVQKYERGTNRISGSRLHAIAKVLKSPIDHFFIGADKLSGITPAADDDVIELIDSRLLDKAETLELTRRFYRIRSPDIRRSVLNMVRAMAGSIDRRGT